MSDSIEYGASDPITSHWAERSASDRFTKFTATAVDWSNSPRLPRASVSWQLEQSSWYSAWCSMPGINQYARLPYLDAWNVRELSKMVGEVVAGVYSDDMYDPTKQS